MKISIVIILIISLFFICCKHDSSDEYKYRPPENTNDGFDVGSLREVNIDSAIIIKAVASIYEGKYKEIHSMLIYRNGKLALEEYYKGHRFKYDGIDHHGEWVTWDRDSLHRIMSVTKSITSACIGIAIDNGFIESVHQSVFDYLPQHQNLSADGKDKITIEHLLTMTSGLQGNEWLVPYSNPKNDIIMTYWADNPITYVFNKPLIYKPGKNFQYYGGSNLVLGEIIRYATKLNLDEFCTKYLFDPLGIESYDWIQVKNGVVDGAGGLKISSRDMTKIGVTFLNKGVWKGKQIISEQWVDKSATSFPGNNWMNNWDDHWGMKGYSYSWWTHTFSSSGKRMNMYYAAGWGGQYIMVMPALNTVVVFTGGNYISYRPPFEILKKYIIPAII